MDNKQEFLTKIVKAWKPSMKPEFRGFRCAICQEYITKSWHHELESEEYLVPVHLCEKCQEESNIEDGEFKAFQCDKCGTELYNSSLTPVIFAWGQNNNDFRPIFWSIVDFFDVSETTGSFMRRKLCA